MKTLKKYWLAFVGFVAVVVAFFLARPYQKSGSKISELQKAEEKIRDKRIEEQKKEADTVNKDIAELNSSRKPPIKVEDSDVDKLAEEYKKL